VSTQAPIRTPRPVPDEAQVGGEKIARSRGFEWLARSGFVARGLIYAIIGILAIELALGVGGRTTNQQGALKTIAQQPFGQILLILVAVGLAGYALWRLLHALLGHGPEDSDSGFERIAALGSGIVYAGLCAIAVEILLGSGSSGGSSNTPKTTAGVLGWPGGTWLIGIAGTVLIGVGLYQGYRGITKDFLKDSNTEQMSPKVRHWVESIGSFGHLARMVVFGLVGVFLIKAAFDYNPNKAVGLDGALAKLAHASYGAFFLATVAAGLVAFAAYSLSDARYRRI
jgi:fumarate reductase subunit D